MPSGKIFKVFKRSAQVQSFPDQVVLIVANPRSGSTWLLDALRCHPAIEMITSGVIYAELDLLGRRYPRDLATDQSESKKIDVRPDLGKKGSIPLFSIQENDFPIPDSILQQSYAVEKIHPHYYHFRENDLLKKVKNLQETGCVIKFIYLVRDPKATLVSFFNYQKRNPEWNKNKQPADVFNHLSRTYQNILDTALLIPGLIIDYGDVQTHFQMTLLNIFEYLWPAENHSGEDTQKLIDDIKRLTSWEIRKSDKLFLGDKKGLISGFVGDYDGIFVDFEDQLIDSYKFYQSLLALKSINPAGSE